MQGDLSDVNNYRPISVIAEIFERIIYDQLCNCFIGEGINFNQPSRFSSFHSTALLDVTDSWAFDINGKHFNSVVTFSTSILLVMISFYLN